MNINQKIAKAIDNEVKAVIDDLYAMNKDARYDRLEEIVEDVLYYNDQKLSADDVAEIANALMDGYDFNMNDVVKEEIAIKKYFDDQKEADRRIRALDEITVEAIEQIVEDVYGYSRYDYDSNLEEKTMELCEEWDVPESEVNEYYGYGD